MEIHRINRRLTTLQLDIEQRNISDFSILGFDNNNTLTLAGSFDFSYYHDIEIMFKNVSFLSCPSSFFKANRFRLANEEEQKHILALSHGYSEGFVICLEDTDFQHRFYLSAEDIDYVVGTVYYYKREQLLPHERIADWVK